MGLKLFEIGEEFERLETVLIESGGEWTEEVEAAFAELGNLERDKVDAYGFLIKGIESRRAAYLKAVEEISAKAAVSKNAVERLKARLGDYLRFRKLKEIKGTVWTLARQGNGGLQPLILASENPEDFPEICRHVSVTIDTEKVRECIEAGQISRGLASLGERGEHVRVK